MTTVVRGLNNILGSGTEFITFEEGVPKVLLFIDWDEDLIGVREHYEQHLNPRYIRCPGKDVCPLCEANPSKIPALRVKFRVYDPTDGKVKMISFAKSHIQSLRADFNLDEVDPRRQYVKILRTGKDKNNTKYSARAYRPDPANGAPEYAIPNIAELDMPDLIAQVTPHTPEEIQGFMNALIVNTQASAPANSVPNMGAANQGAMNQGMMGQGVAGQGMTNPGTAGQMAPNFGMQSTAQPAQSAQPAQPVPPRNLPPF